MHHCCFTWVKSSHSEIAFFIWSNFGK
jgi:hypothetical protein